MTTWLIQPVKIELDKIQALTKLLKLGGIDYDIVYPLEGKILTPERVEYVFDNTKQYFVCGSYSLTRYAALQRPDCVFSLEDYKVEDLMGIFGVDNFVNSQASIVHTKDIDWRDEYFVRPIDDTKSFNGGVHNANTLKYEGLVMIAPLQHISKEYRFFVINQKIVTASQYKLNGELYESSLIDRGAQEFAQTMIEKFNMPGFVIDIAQVDNSYKIMELNCLNASGLYQANLYKLVLAVEDYYADKKLNDLNHLKSIKI